VNNVVLLFLGSAVVDMVVRSGVAIAVVVAVVDMVVRSGVALAVVVVLASVMMS